MKKFKWDQHSEYINFYKKEGYVILENDNTKFLDATKKIFEIFNAQDLSNSKEVAFLNKDGVARHKIDIMRNDLFVKKVFDDYINNIVFRMGEGVSLKTPLYYTHCKLSFKVPNAEVSWFPHQDIGYKDPKEIRNGFALFQALENMNKDNGALELYEGSHKVGRINHDRIKENVDMGDSQMEIDDLSSFSKLTINLNMGDIVIFSQYMVHSSGVSTNNSHRLSLISEVEELKSLRLDDYGKMPIFIGPKKISIFSKIYLVLKSYVNPSRYWFMIRKINGLNKIARKVVDFMKRR